MKQSTRSCLERFPAVREWASEHWGLTLLNAINLESNRTLKPYKHGYLLVGHFPGNGHRSQHFRSLAAVERALEFKSPRQRKPRSNL